MKNFKLIAFILLFLVASCSKQTTIDPNSDKIENLGAVYIPAMVIGEVIVTHNLAMKFTIQDKPSAYYYKVDSGNWVPANWSPGQYIITGIPGDHEIGVKVIFLEGQADSASAFFKGV